MSKIPIVSYEPSPLTHRPPLFLVVGAGTPEKKRFVFHDQVVIGRFHPSREGEVGMLLIHDDTVSRRHCVITQTEEGLCHVRDVSRNGTWLDGRRLVPNIETDMQVGQVISVGAGREFVLEGEATAVREPSAQDDRGQTVHIEADNLVTVLVGDIRDYTVMVREAPSADVQNSVGKVFHELEKAILQHGGMMKEYQGDAIFAYWDAATCENQAVEACKAALELTELVRGLANDKTVWDVPGFPLQIDWALTTGRVVIRTMGGDRVTGMAMVGEPVVLAFRIEKLANDETGPILACVATKDSASEAIEFKDLGEAQAKGFDVPTRIFAVLGSKTKPE